MTRRSRAKLMPRAIAAGQRFAKRAEKLPYFQSATDAYTRGWMAGYRAHQHDVEPPQNSGGASPSREPDGSQENLAPGPFRDAPPNIMPDGARRTKCIYCGWTFGTHRADCPGPLEI